MAVSIKKTSSLLFLLRLLRMLLTVVTVTFTAKFFGVSVEKDMWVLASALVATITSAIWGPLNEVFRTKFVFLKEQEGEGNAIRKTASLIGFVFVVSLALVILIFVTSPVIGTLMTENLANASEQIFVMILILLVPTLLINEMANIGISVLNAYDVFYLPEIVGFVSGIVNLGAIILLAPVFGIYSLLVATYFGSIVLFLVVVFFLYKKRINIWNRLLKFKWIDIRVFLLFSLPFFFPYFAGQINFVFEKYLSGMLGAGMISSLDYSRQFINMLQSVISSVLTTIFVPILAKMYITKDREGFIKTLKENLAIMTLILCTASIFLTGATKPLCQFFFYRGRVSWEALQIIIRLTRMFGIAFWGVIVYIIFGLSLLASDKGKLYAAIGIANQILILLINLLCMPLMGIWIFPISYGIVHLLSGLYMFYKLDVDSHVAVIIPFVRGMLVTSVVVIFYYYLSDLMTGLNSFVCLLLIVSTLVVTIPVEAELIGIKVKKQIVKLYNKYGKR